ncbi:hypothetical protein EMCRGX_G023302 [Ephydatia muelleri]
MKAQALILVSLVIRRFSTAALTNTDPQVTCNNSLSGSGWSSSNCPFVPCSIAKCPRLPSAECHNDYCDGCNHKYYLQGYDVTALCDPCSSTQCPPQTVCYFDSYNAPYCAQPCSIRTYRAVSRRKLWLPSHWILCEGGG